MDETGTSRIDQASVAPLPAAPVPPDPATAAFYVRCMGVLDDAAIPYVVGGGYAMAYYTGIRRNTKDLDLFVKPSDHRAVLDAISAAGYRTEYFYPFWIAKALHKVSPGGPEAFIDLIYNSGNGLWPVDDGWFVHSTPIDVLGYRTRLVPAEEQLWSKAFVQDRDRFDGADVAYLILTRGSKFDWPRLVRRVEGAEGGG